MPEPTPGEICLAVYRPDAKLLERQLLSIREQSVTDWTCRIGIDGRDLDTAATVTRLVGDDQRFVVHHFPSNVGFYRNFERLLTLVDLSAPWVALSDQDDYWYPEKLQTLMQAMSARGAAAVTGQARIVDTAGRRLGETARSSSSAVALLFDNQLTGSLAMLRGDVVQRALPFPNPTDVAYHDHWLGVVATTMGPIEFVPRLVQDYVQHDANVVGEEMGRRPLARVASLRAATRDRGGTLAYLATHRWGWRVRMAATAAGRVPPGSRVAPGVERIGTGRLAPSDLLEVGAGVCRGEVKPGRAAALVMGCLASRLRLGAVGRRWA